MAEFWVFLATLAIDIVLGANSALAQLQPDNTLGNEGSVVQPIDQFNDQIDGGAFRGRNLFHSFQDFNVDEGRGVYFANPTGIENILSRVTGQNSSQILGRLGVLGEANLFFLNPNGIVFGPNASLDISGSFHASTASGISLGEQGFFSASQPEESRLLSVNPGVLFFNQVAIDPGSIINQGQLSVGERQSLSLSGNSVFHNATLKAPGGLVALQGNQVSLQDKARVDTSSSTAGGRVLIGGDASKHNTNINTSRTFIGPEVTIDANALTQGDGGRVEVLADEVTGFYGQINVRGGSLSGDGGFVEVSGQEHVLFRGTVDASAPNGTSGLFLLDPVNITIANGSGDDLLDGPDTFEGDQSGLAGAVLSAPLSEFDDTAPTTIFESELEGLAGDSNISLQATNDIQVEDLLDNELTFAPGSGFIELIADADQDGFGSFVMQDSGKDKLTTNGRDIYIAGTSLKLGSINTSLAKSLQKSGDINLKANNGSINTWQLNTSNSSGDGGDIVLEAIGDIITNDDLNSSSFSGEGNSGDGGDITLSSYFGDVITNDRLDSSSFSNISFSYGNVNSGNGGNISVSSISGDITTNQPLDSSSHTRFGSSGNGGNISVSSISGDIITNKSLDSSSFSNSYYYFNLNVNSGNGGNISVSSISGDITTNKSLDSSSYTKYGSSGKGGNISVSSISGDITTKILDSSSDGNVSSGNGGNIYVSSTFGDITTGALVSSSYAGGSSGKGGNISVSSTSGDITTNQPLNASTYATFDNSEKGGNISVSSISGNIKTYGVLNSSSYAAGSSGKGGNISVSSTSGDIITNQPLNASSFATFDNSGKGGNISVSSTSGDIITNQPLNASSQAVFYDSGNGGDISVSSTSGDITMNQSIGAGSGASIYNSGNGGNISVSSTSGDITIEGIFSGTFAGVIFGSNVRGGDSGSGGNISVSSTSGDITTNQSLNSSSFSVVGASGNGGNISVSSTSGNITNQYLDSSSEGVLGNGGNISISSTSGDITNTNLNSRSFFGEGASGNGGDISISSTSGDITNTNLNSRSYSFGGNSGNGGNIFISSTSGNITNKFGLNSSSKAYTYNRYNNRANSGNGGDIKLSTISGNIKTTSLNSSSISVESGSAGDGGYIFLSTNLGDISINGDLESFSLSIDEDAGQAGTISLLANNGSILGSKNQFSGRNNQLTSISIATSGGKSEDGGLITLAADKISALEIFTFSSVGNSGNVHILGSGKNLAVNELLVTTSVQVEIPNPVNPIETIKLNLNNVGQSGDTLIQSAGSLTLNNVELQSNSNSSTEAGDVIIRSPGQINLIDSLINSNANSTGDAGNVGIITKEGVRIAGENSSISAQTSDGSEGNGGSISINAPQFVTLGANSKLIVETSGTGQAGNIEITSDTITIKEDAELSATATESATNTNEDGGNITIQASNLDISGELGIFAETEGQAPAGTLIIRPYPSEPNLNIQFRDEGFISASTTASGNGGDITIKAPQVIDIRGAGKIAVETSGSGNAGNINISSRTLTLADEVDITASTTSKGNAGSINLDANHVNLQNTSVNAFTKGSGNAGSITISQKGNTSKSVILDTSLISTTVDEGASSNQPSNITLKTQELSLSNNSAITASTAGRGGAGDINVQDAQSVALDNNSAISSGVQSTGKGEGGNINLDTQRLALNNESAVTANTAGIGGAGDINVQDAESLDLNNSSISSEVEPTGNGEGGNIQLDTQRLTLDNQSKITVSTFGNGSTGTIKVSADKSVILADDSEVSSVVNQGAIGDSNLIDLETPNLLLREDSKIAASTVGTGSAGEISVLNANAIVLDDSQITTQVGATAKPNSINLSQPGIVNLNSDTLSLINNARISAITEGSIDAGNIIINGDKVYLTQGSTIESFTRSDADAGSITVGADEQIIIVQEKSGLFAQTENKGNAGVISLTSPQLTIAKGAAVSAQTSDEGNGGSIDIHAPESISLGSNSQLTVESSGSGKTGNISITSDTLTIGKDAQLSATATDTATNAESGVSITINASNLNLSGQLGIFAESQGQAPAGKLKINPDGTKSNLKIQFRDEGFISASTTASGPGGDITISAPQTIDIRGDGKIAVETSGTGDAGNINLNAQTLTLADGIDISASTTGDGNAGNIKVTATQLDINSGSQILTSTADAGDSGDISLLVRDDLTINGQDSGLFANTTAESTGKAGRIFIDPISVKLSEGARISVSSEGAGEGGSIQLIADQLSLNEQSEITANSEGSAKAGNIKLNISGLFSATDSNITTEAAQSSGGVITINAEDIRLNNSDIQTNVARGKGGGGNIELRANSILAFGDSDIFAFAKDGRGGDIILNTPVFVGEGYTLLPAELDPAPLEGNGLVNINATGKISTGTITTPDVSFIEESLTEFPEAPINTTDLIANSCIVRTNVKEGKFIVTGAGGVPDRPGNVGVGSFPTGTVQSVPQQNSASQTDPTMSWEAGAPIIEPQGVYRLADGQIVMSRECSQ